MCCAFLRYWTEVFCQVDGGGHVLWPQGRTITDVFATTFKEWLAEQNAPESIEHIKVSLSTFRNALASPEFKHVKMRKEHNHVRCDQYAHTLDITNIFRPSRSLPPSPRCAFRCKALQEMLNAGFENKAAELKYLDLKRGHEAMVEDFRKVEKYWLGQARHSREDVHMFQYDDTSPFLLPHFGNREGKSVAGNARIPFVPWLVENVGLGQKTYVYSFKGGTSKGANRWSPVLVNSCSCSLIFV
jgi:hypothetical protein